MFKKLLPKSEFSKNVVTLMTGTTIAQAIPIAITPILTRIYTPEDFGVLTLYMSMCILFGNISNARYELAIMKPTSEEEANNVARLSLLIAFTLSMILLLFIVIFHSSIIDFFNNENLKYWIYLIPLTVFLLGLYNVLNYANSRKKLFGNVSKANVIKSISLGFFQLTIPFSISGASGLIIGYIMSNFLGNVNLFRSTFDKKNRLFDFDFKRIVNVAKKYNEFPKFTLPAAISNSITLQFSNVLISNFYSIQTLGFYALSQRLLSVPISLIASAIGQVFFQKSTEELSLSGSARETFLSTFKKLFIIGAPIFLVLFFTLEPIFGFVFGEKWAIAGTYSKILIPLFFARFIIAPISVLNVVYKKNKTGFYWQTGLLILQFSIIIFAEITDLNFETFLYVYSALSTVHYFFLFYIIFQYTKVVTND